VLLEAGRALRPGRAPGVDPFTSGAWFDGWRGQPPEPDEAVERPVAPARTWLLRKRWRRLGLLPLGPE